MLNPAISSVVFASEMLIAYIFFSNMFEKRFPIVKCLGIGSLLYICCAVANLLSSNNGIVNLATATIINVLFSYICFESGFRHSIFYSVILSAVNASIEIAVITTVGALTDSDFLDYNNNFPLFLLECSTSKLLYFFLILIFTNIVKFRTTITKLPFNLFLYPVSSSVCLVVFWYINALPETPYTTQNLLAVASMFLLAATILLFVTYQHQIEKDCETMQMQREYEKLQTEKSYFQILEQQNEQLSIFAHDAKNHLAAINSLNSDPQISNYVSQLSQQLNEYSRNCHSGNKLLDVIIHRYSVDCNLRGIHFDYDVKLCNLKMVDDIDLVAILGNLLDNAVTAAEKSAQKMVSLSTAQRNSYNIIIISNSCDVLPKTKGAKLITSKANRDMHGFGLKSVKRTLKKYQGDFEWFYEERSRKFTVTVMIGDSVKPKLSHLE